MTFGDAHAWNLHGVSQIDLLEWLAVWHYIGLDACDAALEWLAVARDVLEARA